MESELTLPEEVLLLGLDDDSGRIEPQAFKTLEFTVAGAIIAELSLRGAIQVDSDDATVRVVEDATGGDKVLDWALASLQGEAPNRIGYWIPRFVRTTDLRQDVAELLCERGILERKKQSFMLIFRGTNFPEKDAAPERALTERLRAAIFEDDAVSERTAALIALIDATELLHVKFDPEELEQRKSRIHEIASARIKHNVTARVLAAARESFIEENVMMSVILDPFR